MTHEDRIEKCIAELWRREEFYATARLAAAEAEHIYRIKLAVEFGKAEGAVEARKMEAIEMCQYELINRDVSAAASDIAYQKLLDARDVLSARQSLLKASLNRGV